MTFLSTLRRHFDAALQPFTRYKGISMALAALLVIAFILALFGVVQENPLGILLMTVVITASAFATNYLLARIYRVAAGSDTTLITALIIACILLPGTDTERLAVGALAGAVAVASKYVLAWRHGVVFNPAVVGAFVVSVTGLASAGWWIATPALLPVVAGIAAVTVYRSRQFGMLLAYFGAAVAVALLTGSVDIKTLLLSYPLAFLGGIMLTEPNTIPSQRYQQWLYGGLVGALLTAQLDLGFILVTPLMALLLGNLFSAIVSPPFSATLQVRSANFITPEIFEVITDRPKRQLYEAGQYMEWTLDHPKQDIRGNRRSMSLASAPSEDTLRIAVRVSKNASSFKRSLQTLTPGKTIRASKVAGSFIVPEGSAPLLFIAGGIGITPFRSMIAELVASGRQRGITLIYIARNAKEHAYKELFDKAAPFGVTTEYVIGRVAGDSLCDVIKPYADRQIYISGPQTMVKDYAQALRQSGVVTKNIHTDQFTGY